MNFKLLAIFIIALTFLFRTYILWLEMKSAHRPIPENVQDIYDTESYQKWLKYDNEKSRLAFIRHLVSYAFIFIIVGTDLYAKITGWLSLTGLYAAAVGVLAADMLITLLYAVPCEYVDSMIIEQKYGFNRMTKKTFLLDQIKSLLIELILMIGLCCAFIAIHKVFGNWLIVIFGAIVFALLLLIAFLYPVFSKIFNKFEPLPEGELRTRLCSLLKENGLTVKEIKVMDGSKRSTKANAYFSGFGKMKTIVLYDTLLEQMTPDEIVAVFAHEMGHNKHKDTLKMQFMNIINVIVIVLVAWALVSVSGIYPDFGFAGVNYGFAFFLLGTVCLSFISPFLGLFSGYMSRRFEYRADRFAAENGYGAALISALKVLSRNSFICLSPHPLLVKLDYDHPTVSQRIAAIEACGAGMKNHP